MKFNDITITKSPADAARTALRRESIVVKEGLSGRRLRNELAQVQEEINALSSQSGAEYARAILHKAIYEEMAADEVAGSELGDGGLEQAEAIIAAKSMNSKFQDMLEDVADMQGSDLITLVDQIKARFGDAAGEQYGLAVKTALDTAITALSQSKDALDAATKTLQTGEMAAAPVSDLTAEPGAEEAPIFPSSAGPEEMPTGREMKSEIA